MEGKFETEARILGVRLAKQGCYRPLLLHREVFSLYSPYSLTVKYHFPYIKIMIEDNGVGLKEKGASNKALGGVGIQNVQERLALYFGEEFKMEFDSVENSYTKVFLTIPISVESHN